jgi:hypothetical protein
MKKIHVNIVSTYRSIEAGRMELIENGMEANVTRK